ncbi:hypothetical protein U879_15025 [Defluviimonas sp. 20V17]|uniref:Outer membrane protein n=1 Tax=Allgaiera indica TaxID=765699 RepID=A0AAN4ZZ37_9RHOB|nr:OmpH family outer membrane protein [Allgaiera indica]KDB02859.1 hypothetical protein U879_15025 [Defluviimonas sp. 20V17]GHE01348.1 outer membrane protein [Allgaiera indica]SDW85180.1 periplasmic chaperone for outer membrane proteins Skp [Allgaiera indica]
MGLLRKMFGGVLAAPLAVGIAGVPLPGGAQVANYPLGQSVNAGRGAVQSPVLTLDRDRMFADSDFGKRVAAEVAAAQARLLAENHKKETALADEEKKLTDERKTVSPEAFEKLANAFDAKVQKIRRDQDAKNRIIQAWRQKERQRFYEAALPILGQLVRDSGAVAILNSQAVFLSFKSIDVTDRAIARLDATLGDGAKGAGKIDLSASPPPAPSVSDGDAGSAPREVAVPGVGEAVAPNGVAPPGGGAAASGN